MRLMAFTCVSLAFCLALPSGSSAQLRHYSSRLLDTGGNEGLLSLAPGPDGTLFLVLDLGGGTLGGATGTVLAKFDAAGRLLWARPLPTLTQGFTLAATPDGGVVGTGGFGGTIDFGGGPMTATDTDVLLVKFDAAGGLAWQRRYGGNQWQYSTNVAVDSAGNIVITGSNSLTIDFGGGTIRSNGSDDGFLAKFDANAGHLWSRGFGYGGSQRGLALDIGADNRIALAVSFGGLSVDLGDGQVLNLGGSDVAAAVFDATGALVFTRYAGTSYSEVVYDVALDTQGNFYLCGTVTAPIDVGGGVLTPLAPRSTNGFMASYSPAGAHRWSSVIPDPIASNALSVGADDYGNCFVMGVNVGEFTFGLDDVTPSSSLLLVFDPAGDPLDALGFSQQQMRLEMSPARDRLLLAVTTSTKINFGGKMLVPLDTDVALAEMGARHPAQVSITDLDARPVSDGVEVSWSLASGEPLGNLWLNRRTGESSRVDVLTSRIAVDGGWSFGDRTAIPGHTYSYRVTVATAFGDEVYSDWVSVEIPPVVNALEQNAPNPFNPLTTFAYSLAAPADVTVVIYDTRGAVIARLEQGMQPAGRHAASWGGHNMHGEFVASGVYYYRLEGVPGVGPRKMLLLK
ncbi:MAG TPA: FlgD immunoglobulin-like domain containing protein [Candidatus Krumholzibacteria bacterium]